MTPIRFFVPGEPKPQGSKKGISRPGAKFAVFVEACKELPAWRQAVSFAAMGAKPVGFIAEKRPLRLLAVFTTPRPSAHYNAKGLLKASASERPLKPPDLDKLVRAIGDALTGILLVDDSHLVQHEVDKVWGAQPGVFVQVDDARPLSLEAFQLIESQGFDLGENGDVCHIGKAQSEARSFVNGLDEPSKG